MELINMYEIFGEELNNAKHLGKIGINEYAWDYEHLCVAIEILRKKGIPILGGDVYVIDGQNIKSTYDSWFTKKNENEDYCQSSYIQTLKYINIFEMKSNKYIYSIVI